MGIARKLVMCVLVLAAAYGAWQGAVRVYREYVAYRQMQQATLLMWQYLSAPVGTRTLPDGTSQPVSRADWLAEVGARAAAKQ